MSREAALARIVEASIRMQASIADILEAKAAEAEKSRSWICGRLYAGSMADDGERVKQALEIHEQLIEVIEGLTKMENALSQHLQLWLAPEDTGGGDGSVGFGMGSMGGMGMGMGMGGVGNVGGLGGLGGPGGLFGMKEPK